MTYDTRWHDLRYRDACGHSPDENGRDLDKLLGAMFPTAIPDDLQSFSTDRLVQVSRELSRRLSIAAYRSAEWTAMLEARRARGPGDHGLANRVVARLIEDGDLVREILAPLRARGLSVRVTGVEKVLIAPSEKTPLADSAEFEIETDRLLPFDAIVGYAVSRESTGRR